MAPERPLSASEEITLRRINYGIAKPGALIARDVERLIELSPVIRQGTRLVLTPSARRHLTVPINTDEWLTRLRELLAEGRRDGSA